MREQSSPSLCLCILTLLSISSLISLLPSLPSLPSCHKPQRCYTGLALAQLVIPSLHLIPTDLHAPIEKLMSQTLRSLSPPALKAYDSEEGLVWCTLLPYIKLLYLQPDRRRVDCEMTPTACSIVALSRDVILLCLHSALLRYVMLLKWECAYVYVCVCVCVCVCV